MKPLIAAASIGLLALGTASAGAATTAAPNQTNSSAQQSTQASIDMQQQVQTNLTKAGFTDVKVMPESFIVRAKDQKGNPVMMVINPDSFTEITRVAPNGNNNGAGNSGSNGSSASASSNTGSNGTTKQQ